MGRRVELLLCNRYQYSHTTLESFFWILVHGKEMRLPMRLYTLPKLSTLSHSWQSYSQGLKCRNNLIVLCWMNGHEDVMHTTIHPQAHPHAEYHSPQKREDPVLSHNTDESRGHCNKWNKPDIERKILQSHLHVKSKAKMSKVKWAEMENAIVETAAWEIRLKAYKARALQRNSLEI